MDEICIGGNPCWDCGADYGEHSEQCSVRIEEYDQKQRPRRFRIKLNPGEKHPNGSTAPFRYGCYFPATDLVISDMGGRGTGMPGSVEWIDT